MISVIGVARGRQGGAIRQVERMSPDAHNEGPTHVVMRRALRMRGFA